ncbi:MAG TPA: nucleoside hydrolase [Methanosarcina sp.]|nr:nucleoside hydrolase [Methanosarcina sp.]
MNLFVVDTDIAYFNDDAIALLMLAACGKFPIAVTTVAGNLTPVLSAKLALYLYSLLGCNHIPVVPGAAKPLAHKRMPYYSSLHGYWDTNIINSPVDQFPISITDRDEKAHHYIVRLAKKHPGLDLLCLGPLTNIALALKLEPKLPSMLGRVVIMGGALLDQFPFRGNVTPKAEFNFWVDPDAAHTVLNSDLKCELITLNVCTGFFFDKNIASGWLCRNDSLGEAFRNAFNEIFQKTPHFAIPMYDQIAAASLLRPEHFTWEYKNITVVRDLDENQGFCITNSTSSLTSYGNNDDKCSYKNSCFTSGRVAVATNVNHNLLRNFLVELTLKNPIIPNKNS